MFRLIIISAAICFPVPMTTSAADPDHPNVLFIAVDDLRVDLGCYGSPDVKTPNIDRLASRGLLFNSAYCQQAVCNPSRASLLTGRRPDTLQVWNLVTHFRDTHPDIVTLPQHFRRQGYFTQNIGKVFHNWRTEIKGDPESWSVPAGMHFNTHYADNPQVEGQLPPDLATVAKNECRDVPDDAYFDGRIATKAVAALDEVSGQNQPWFLAIGFWKPHLPFNAPKKYWDMFDRKSLTIVQRRQPPDNVPLIALHEGSELIRRLGHRPTTDEVYELRHGYVAAIAYLDAQIGRVLDALQASGQADSTIVVFWSDHGFHLGEHDLWCKTSNFELDAQVPMIISVPGMQTAGSRTDALVELLDLYPTLADLCGLEQPAGLEGTSLRPLIEDANGTVKDAAFTQHPRPAYYKGKLPEVMGYSVRTSSHRYTEWRNMATAKLVGTELYDHTIDPDETCNVVASADSAVVHRLQQRLRQQFPVKKW
jgi:iduronate 2-sulfatase